MANRYQYTADRPYLHQLTPGVWLPLVQSGVSGVIVFAAVLVIGFALRWRDPLTWAGVIGVITWGLAWLSLWRHWFHLTGVASMGAIDHEGQPNPDPSLLSQRSEIRVVVSEIRDDGHLTGGQYYDFPCTAPQLLELTRGLIQEDLPFSEKTWCGSGRPFSVIGFRELRSEFISRGLVSLASSKDARQGYNLTIVGRHVLAGILEELTKS